MIELTNLTKRFGKKVAVDDVTLTIRPGVITGFVGPNGAGKSTTIRMILGLDRPTNGKVRIDGHSFAGCRAPLRTVGALVDSKGAQAGRSAYNHLRVLARTNGIPQSRVDEVIEIVGLTEVANQRVGSFSMGMGQRVGIAAALLGDPQTVILDEPANGLDPEGILWIRNLMKALAREGRTVFVSSHLMSEMALTADHLVIIGRGKLMVDMPMSQFIDEKAQKSVLVRSPRAGEVAELILSAGGAITRRDDGALEVTGLTAPAIGDLAGASGLHLHELSPRGSSLEDVFMAMTQDAVEFHAQSDLEAVETHHLPRAAHEGTPS